MKQPGIQGRRAALALALGLGLFGPAAPVAASGKGKAAQEAVEYAARKFGWKAGKEGLETAARKLESFAAKHGDDMLAAFRQIGPKSFAVAEKHGVQGLRLVARHGEAAVVHVLSKPQAVGLVAKHGDDAARALIKHAGVAEPVLERLGAPAVKALDAVGAQGGRRLAMMHHAGDLAKIGRTNELLGVVGKYGDGAMDFIYRHRTVLAGSAALGVFLANPEPFLNGAAQLADVVAENTLKPLAEGAGGAFKEGTSEIARQTNWTLIFGLGVALAGGLVGAGLWLRHRREAHASHHPT